MTMPMLKDMDKDRLQWCKCVFRVLSVSFFSMFLVFEDIENGTLKAHLNDRLQSPLNWRTRLQIVIGVAAELTCSNSWSHHTRAVLNWEKQFASSQVSKLEPYIECTKDDISHLNAAGRDHITEVEMIIAEEFWKIMKQHKQHPQSAFTLPRGVNEQQQESHRTTARESSSLNREQKQVAVLVLVIDQESH
ncbi:hypothetical protein ACSBR2_003464 [Camellia fascicularis]